MLEKKLGFVGFGLMAEALLDGILKTNLAPKKNIYAADPDARRQKLFTEKTGAEPLDDNISVLERTNIVLLCVKPQILPTVAEEIARFIEPDHLFISIAPGITLSKLSKKLGTDRVVRVMPNTPALIGEGAAGYCCGAGVQRADRQAADHIFSAVGLCIEVEEKLIDVVTGLSGSGPAYIFVAIEALADGAVKMGLPRKTALELAAQTALGAAKMLLESRTHPAELKDRVTTPGGTTIAALHALEKAGFRRALIDAVTVATEKSRDLGAEEND